MESVKTVYNVIFPMCPHQTTVHRVDGAEWAISGLWITYRPGGTQLSGFYLAEQMEKLQSDNGGWTYLEQTRLGKMSLADLEDFLVDVRKPVTIKEIILL